MRRRVGAPYPVPDEQMMATVAALEAIVPLRRQRPSGSGLRPGPVSPATSLVPVALRVTARKE